MKFSLYFAVFALSLILSACSTGKINYRINDQGQMVVQKTVDGEFAIQGDAADASSEAAEYEKNMTIKAMYGKYLALFDKGDFEGAKKLRIEIEVLRGKVASTPDTPVLTPKNKKDSSEMSSVSPDEPNYWKKRKEEIREAKRKNKKVPLTRNRFKND